MIIQDKLRDFYRRFLSLQGDPGEIAMGMAIGVFVSITPTIPFHTALIVLIGITFRQNILAAYIVSWLVSNPLTIPLLYLSQYKLGRFILGMGGSGFQFNDYSLRVLASAGREILVPLLVGGICMAPFFAVPAYFIARYFVSKIRKRTAS
ncbi:MAG: DUF2062 domain-containing protein [Syntrophales bacterium]